MSDTSEGLKASPKNLRTFGIGGACIFTTIWALRLFVFHHGNAWLFLVLAGYLFLTGLFIHSALKPVFIGWSWVAHKIGWFNTRLILGIIFYLVFTPIGFMIRLFGKDPLNRKLEPEKQTYWIPVDKKFDKLSYEKEF